MPEIIDVPVRMTPVAAAERIDTIDILRGMALFGILMANMRGFSAPEQVYFNIGELFKGAADQFVQGFVDLFVQGKFITLFAFLFGLGFAVQMTRAEERGKSVSFYPRRLAVLLCFGLLHSWLIWWGDILVGYALTGLVLFFFRKRTQKTVATIGLALFFFPVVMNLGFLIWTRFHGGPPNGGAGADNDAEYHAAIQHAISVYRDGSYIAAVKQRFQDWKSLNAGVPFLVFAYVLPRFLAGLWVWRTGILKNVQEKLPTIRRVWAWALFIGFLADGIPLFVHHFFHPAPTHGPTLRGILLGLCQRISFPALSTFYATSVVLALQSPRWKRLLASFGAVGRTALTNYLMQSLVCTWFFHLTKLYGKVGPAWDLIPTFVLFSIQIPLSVWWLKHYQFGPVEWLWRSLTYGYRPPMRRSPVEIEPAVLGAPA